MMAKEATNSTPSMQIERYCLAVHKKPLSAQEWRNRQLKKSDFVIFFLLLSHTKLLTSIAYKLKQLLSYFTQNNIAFIVVAPFSLFVCKLARVAVLASCGFATF